MTARGVVWAWIVLAVLLASSQPVRAAEGEGRLTLAEVLAALPGRHPSWEVADRKVEAARGKRLSARGAFDPSLAIGATLRPIGYYPSGQLDVKVEQATGLWGAVAFAGWRYGQGSFPVYDGRLETARAGEVRAGMRMPLVRDRAVDRRRTDRRQADRLLDAAQQRAAADRLALQLAAAKAYWAWVAAAQRLQVADDLVQLAERRQGGLLRMVDAGALPEMEAIDNERSLADRSLGRVEATRRLDAAAVALSLYWRDAEGRPRTPAPAQAPTRLPEPPPAPAATTESHVADALARRPELRALEQELEVAELELRWARNQRAPDVSVQAYVARDLGPGPERLLPTDLVVSLGLELPVPLRKARGQLAATQADLARLRAERRRIRDEVTATLRTVDIALAAALEQRQLAVRQAALAEQVAAAERRRLELGASNVLTVNLREQVAAEAALELVDAAIAAHVAHAEHRAAQGLPPR